MHIINYIHLLSIKLDWQICCAAKQNTWNETEQNTGHIAHSYFWKKSIIVSFRSNMNATFELWKIKCWYVPHDTDCNIHRNPTEMKIFIIFLHGECYIRNCTGEWKIPARTPEKGHVINETIMGPRHGHHYLARMRTDRDHHTN